MIKAIYNKKNMAMNRQLRICGTGKPSQYTSQVYIEMEFRRLKQKEYGDDEPRAWERE